ncbi:PREDICTED: PDZK1-interacting protein 1 [Thamnophis sirtalis]|uniref:PDZK1-interacting protein 1 n=1 Tax=Thamnophis sirtalis TaxID=35019 RepID=A0A6I9Y3R1_9SAUR|nr:PREDICTED: PDZK1-interacting protein 1 [Thamnophis sirtalis]
MKTFLFVTLCLFAACDPVNCQGVIRTLDPWLQGVIAVSVFLFLAMISFIINKLWCQDEKDSKEEDKRVTFRNRNTKASITSNGMEGTYSASAASFSCEEGPHCYENQVEFECDTVTNHHTECHASVDSHCDTRTECHENIDVVTTNM